MSIARLRPYAGVAPARATLRVAKAKHPFTAHDYQVRAARSGGGPKAQRAGPAVLRTAKARPKAQPKTRPKSVGFGLSPTPPPRRSAPGRQGQRFEEPRYSLSAYSSSPPAESSNELRRVAVRRVRWRRTARLKEPQEQRLFLSSSALSSERVEDCGAQKQRQLRASAAGGFGPRDPMGRRSSAQSTAPILRPVSASLRLRFRSAAFYRRPLGFHLDFAHRKTSEIPLYAGGRRSFREWASFFARL